MSKYNVGMKRFKELIQQICRDFALEYSEIQKSKLSESEKETKINKLTENTKKQWKYLQGLRENENLSEISNGYYKENLGIKEVVDPEVDENIVNTLVSIFAKRAKIPYEKNRGTKVLDIITLREGETLEDVDTTAFENELKQYFTKHYSDLYSTGEVNWFISAITENNGDLSKIARKYNIDPEKFEAFGYQLTVQDGLVAEEGFHR